MKPLLCVFAMLLAAGGSGCLLQGCGGAGLGSGHSDGRPADSGASQAPGSGGAAAQGGGGAPGSGGAPAGGATVTTCCTSCGNSGEACCPSGSGQDRCQAGNLCSTTSGDGMCSRCGGLGDICCANNACSEGCCSGGRCLASTGVCTATPDASIVPDAPAVSTDGKTGTGGMVSTGGTVSTGGIVSTGGVVATGGKVTSGGMVGTGGTVGTGGIVGAGGTATSGSTSTACKAGPSLTGGTQHCDDNSSGSYGNYQWSLWKNGDGGCITTYTDGAFSASWKNSGDLLARVGLAWDSSKTYDQLGTISAEFAETKTGTAGSYSYIGVHGLTANPCVDYYIVEDSFNTMPVKPSGATNKGTAEIDGDTYIFYALSVSGIGAPDCSGSSGWKEFYSVRQTARQCGHISISRHFAEWANKGMTLGKMEEAMIVVEAGGGTGGIDFTTATVTAQ